MVLKQGIADRVWLTGYGCLGYEVVWLFIMSSPSDLDEQSDTLCSSNVLTAAREKVPKVTRCAHCMVCVMQKGPKMPSRLLV